MVSSNPAFAKIDSLGIFARLVQPGRIFYGKGKTSMTDPNSLHPESFPVAKPDNAEDMAAQLLAELFYKQYIMEREQAKRQATTRKLTACHVKTYYQSTKPRNIEAKE